MKKPTRVTGISVFLILLIVLPAIFYSAYEFNSLSTSEEMFSEIYTRQLDAILFSVNQYAWDVLGNWTNVISSTESDLKTAAKDSLHQLRISGNPALRVLFFCDTAGTLSRILTKGEPSGFDTTALSLALKQNREKLSRIVRYNRTGYRKLESLYLGDSLGTVAVAIV
ncbi:MAG: hypothetical protein ABI623_09065, partial [bacterium]